MLETVQEFINLFNIGIANSGAKTFLPGWPSAAGWHFLQAGTYISKAKINGLKVITFSK
jgi:hypothetical protein